MVGSREPVSESESELEDDEPGVRYGEEYQVRAYVPFTHAALADVAESEGMERIRLP